ncbi:GIY-YIG nuclease family protein [bacterium]|nr:GIY-YIG nuclease family protein [bacterium]
MYYVYILFSLKDKKLYTGFSKNLEKRIIQHKNGSVKSTTNRRPLILIYYEVYLQKIDAEKREKYLKGGNGRASIKIQLKNQLSKLNYKYL